MLIFQALAPLVVAAVYTKEALEAAAVMAATAEMVPILLLAAAAVAAAKAETVVTAHTDIAPVITFL